MECYGPPMSPYPHGDASGRPHPGAVPRGDRAAVGADRVRRFRGAAGAVRAGVGVGAPILRRAARRAPPGRLAPALGPTAAYALSGAVGAALAGPWLVVILLACGAGELGRQRLLGAAGRLWAWTLPR